MIKWSMLFVTPIFLLASMTAAVEARPSLKVDVSDLQNGSVNVDFKATGKSGGVSVNWYINGKYKDSTRITLPNDSIKISSLSKGQKLEIRVLEFYGQGDHWSKTFTVNAAPNVRPSLYVDVSDLRGGRVEVDLKARNRSGGVSVNWYINGQYKDSTRVTLPNAQLTITGLSGGQDLEIRVLEFYGPGDHWSKTFKMKNDSIRPTLSVKMGQVRGGKVRADFSAKHKSGSIAVNYYVGGSFVSSERITLPNASVTISDVRGGDQLEVRVLEFYGQGEHWSKKFQLRVDPNYIPDAKIRDYADQQARTVANKVAGTYGEYERWKYSFAKGFIEAYQAFKDQRRAFERGRRKGESEVGDEGTIAGQSDARNMASSQATSAADQRYMAVVNSQDEPNTEIGSIEVPNYNPQSRRPSHSIDSKLEELNRELRSEMYRLQWSHGNWTLDLRRDAQNLDLKEIYSYNNISEYRFVDGWFRSEYAYQEWKSNRLGGGYDYNIFKKLDNSQKSYFMSEFKKVYDSVIDVKFNRIKYTPNLRAYTRGQYYGEEAGLDQAFQSGRSEGYGVVYRQDAIRSFAPQYEESYEKNFMGRVQFLNSNAVVRLSQVRVLDSGDSNSFESGDELKVTVGSVLNIGRKEAQIKVGLSGKILEDARAEVYTLKPSFRSSETISFENMARISEKAKQNVPYQMSVSLGSYYRDTISFTLSWTKRVEDFAQMKKGSAEYNETRRYLLDQIKKEWLTCLEQSKNWYRVGIDGGTKTLMEQLTEAHAALPANLRSNTRSLQDDLYKIRKMGPSWKGFRRMSFKKLIKKLR